MSDGNRQDAIFAHLAAETEAYEPAGERAPSRLKSRIYSELMKRQAASGPLLGLAETKAQGRGLCVFEELVRIAPVSEAAKQINYCRMCHARLLGESVEHPPIFWPNCPYVDFCNR
jgi:hypothetical protein